MRIAGRFIESGSLGDLKEVPVAIIPEKCVRTTGDLDRISRRDLTTTGEEQVEVSISVEIEQRNTAAQAFQDVVSARFATIPVREMDSAGIGHVFKPVAGLSGG